MLIVETVDAAKKRVPAYAHDKVISLADIAMYTDAEKYDLVVCSGGDGTLDEVVSGIMHKGLTVPLGYIPAGSTNDFATSLGIPKDMVKAADAAVNGVSAGKVVAKGKGKATITVKKGTQEKSCQVTVETPELNKTAVEMDVEDTVSLDLKGCSHDVEWTSSDDDICEVEDGILIPYSSGTVTVKAKVHGMVWKCKVVITDSTEDDWNDDLDDDSDDDSENADDGYMDDEVDAAA